MILRDETILKITEQWARKMEKEKRKLIRKKAIEKYYRKGWVASIVWGAGFMVRKGRKDIAQAVMKEAYLDREQWGAGKRDYQILIYGLLRISLKTDKKGPPERLACSGGLE
jgi:hypothetical protein